MKISQRNTGGLVRIAVTTGGTNYTSPPSVAIAGGGGTGVTAYAQIDSKRVVGVLIASGGVGFTGNPSVSFSGGGGTGASAQAYANTGTRSPACFFKGRHGDAYAVDGLGRGVRWNGVTATPIGIAGPIAGPVITASGTSGSGSVTDIQIMDGGAGYSSPPSMVFTGGTPTVPATAAAEISNGRLTGVTITEPGSGYKDTPTLSIVGGQGSTPSLAVGVLGQVRSIRVTATGSGYTTTAAYAPTVILSSGQGLTTASAVCNVNAAGQIDSVSVLSAGTGATTSSVTAAISGGGGTGAALAVDLVYRVSSVTVASSGSGYYTPPAVVIRAASADPTGSGAAATASVNTAGNLTGVSVYAGGAYNAIPTAIVENAVAKAVATVQQPFVGKYKCCVRYIDATGEEVNGPIASVISELTEVDADTGRAQLSWSITHHYLDARVHAMELWRTSSNQSVLLFRVAKVLRADAGWSQPYTDTLSDKMLTDPDRDGYALMPVTLPSGQINARRFAVPPGEFSVAAMFQDRAWYAVDSTGVRPNALVYSEIDEPESVPDANELIVQENTGSPDKIVALIPLGGMLLVVQQAHLYRLQYVAQPVIDASMTLGAYRGILNWRCWDTMGGAAFIADSFGVYAYDGTNEEPISVPIDNLWRNGSIDFSKSEQFHVACDHGTKTVRFFYCRPSDQEPVRALCYCSATKAWWEEQYPTPVTASCQSFLASRHETVYGGAAGVMRRLDGRNDAGTPIGWELRTGNFALGGKDGSRAVSVLYRPTTGDTLLGLRVHYNDSPSPRANAVATNTGHGFVSTGGATESTLNLKSTRSPLGDSNGFAKAYISGRNDDRSAGADRHISVVVAGTQGGSSVGDEVVLHGIVIEGVG